MGPLLAVRPFKLHRSTRERATFVKWICESVLANTLERGGNISPPSPLMEPIFVCNIPDAVTSRITFLLPSHSLAFICGLHHAGSVVVRCERRTMLFCGKSVKISLHFLNLRLGEWNEFRAQASRLVYYVIVQIASGASENATHSGNAPAIINPHFKCCLLELPLTGHVGSFTTFS